MTTTLELWWQVRERVAAQAWSCDDMTWSAPFGQQTVGSLLTRFTDADATTRLEVSRILQERSESRDETPSDAAGAVVCGWLTLRQIDAALIRPPIDLRSEAALFVGQHLVELLNARAAAAEQGLALRISGPGFVATTTTLGRASCSATMSWPTLIGLAAGTTAIQDSAINLSGDDEAIDAFIDTLIVLPTAVGSTNF